MPLSPQNLGVRFVAVTVLQSVGNDEYGTPLQAPNVFKECKAQVVAMRGQELAAAQQVNAEISTRITFRYADLADAFEDGSLARMYVQYRQQFYDIQGIVSRDQRDQWIDCLCVARVGRAPVFA